MSDEKTLPNKPYSELLAIDIASSKSLNFITDSTGPNISSYAILILGSTSMNRVGSTKNPSRLIRFPPVARTAPSSYPIFM